MRVSITLAERATIKPDDVKRISDQPAGTIWRAVATNMSPLMPMDTWVVVLDSGRQIVFSPGTDPHLSDLPYYGVRATGTRVSVEDA